MLLRSAKILFVVIMATLLATVAINAVDNYDNFEASLIGKIFGLSSSQLCPDDMVWVDAADKSFCIDKYEASPALDCPFSFPQSVHDTLLNMNQSNCRPDSRSASKPWVYVNRDQAEELCRLAGKRLPSAAEWHLAALGTPDNQEASCLLGGTAGPTETGEANACVSAAGAFDMIGNVWEWVSDEVIDGEANGRDLPASGYITAMSLDGLPAATASSADEIYSKDYLWIKSGRLKAVAKGGYYGSGDEGGRFSTYIETEPGFTGPGIGFRCVK